MKNFILSVLFLLGGLLTINAQEPTAPTTCSWTSHTLSKDGGWSGYKTTYYSVSYSDGQYYLTKIDPGSGGSTTKISAGTAAAYCSTKTYLASMDPADLAPNTPVEVIPEFLIGTNAKVSTGYEIQTAMESFAGQCEYTYQGLSGPVKVTIIYGGGMAIWTAEYSDGSRQVFTTTETVGKQRCEQQEFLDSGPSGP